MKKGILYFFIIYFLSNCTATKISLKEANKALMIDSAIATAHIGISVYEPFTNKYWFNYNADKYFVPASNTKLFTLYTALKYLGDSIEGLKYYETADSLFVQPTGDPTFLHVDFLHHPVDDFLSKNTKPIVFYTPTNLAEKYGHGWSWDDFDDYYMAQRNTFPMFGNLLHIEASREENDSYTTAELSPLLKDFNITYSYDGKKEDASIKRFPSCNLFNVIFSKKDSGINTNIPFETNGISSTISFLENRYHIATTIKEENSKINWLNIYSQPVDTVLKKMLFNSDNFYAEQLLLMASNNKLGFFSDKEMIEYVLKTDLKEMPQRPKWVDGSGLSRYNLFSPQNFIFILNKISKEYGFSRLCSILPTGGEGTLKNYFISDSAFVFAKTGTLSSVVALSGIIITKKNKELLFSVLVNNSISSSMSVRKAVERFVKSIRENY